jgi:RHS repeat-associated protein
VKRVGPDGATLYYHDGFRAIWETDAVGNLTNELDRDIFGNLLGRREGSGARRYVHSDGLGSTTALTDEAGAVTASVLYDAWGAVRIYTNPTLLGKYLFTGAEAEGVMPLYHMGARFYAPTLGRWLSEDPVQNAYFNPLTLNFYAYAFNNPALLSDPDGTRVVEFENGVSSDPIREAVTASQEERTPPAGWEAYVDLAVAASRKHGVPAELILAIMARENVAFDPNAVNPTTPDWGLMQVNIHTAPDYGIPLGSESKRLFNPETNISVGTRHLASLLRQFGGNETLAISAYNLGAGAVRRGGPVNTGYINDVQAYERWFRSRRCGGRC